jgi:hypothetical protein
VRVTKRASIGQRFLSLVPYVPSIGFVVALAVTLIAGVDDAKQTALDLGVFWLIGMNGILLGSGHMFVPVPIAESIGWQPSPFQWEVGLANVGWGVVGVTASGFDRDYTLAAIIVFSIFMLGAAAGHVRSMMRDHNSAPGNAGYIFWYDLVAPLLLITLYISTG